MAERRASGAEELLAVAEKQKERAERLLQQARERLHRVSATFRNSVRAQAAAIKAQISRPEMSCTFDVPARPWRLVQNGP